MKYFRVNENNVANLKIAGLELLVYSKIYCLCKLKNKKYYDWELEQQFCTLTQEELGTLIAKKDPKTIRKITESLEAKDLIIIKKGNGNYNRYFIKEN